MEDIQSLLTAVNTLIATDRHHFMAEAMRDEAGGRLSKEATSAFRKQYWANVEASLEERHELLRKELVKPVHLRRKV